MKERYFLRIDGIPGESTDDTHAGEIDVQSWSWGVARAGGASSGSSGKVTFQELQIVAQVSAASPKLVEACATAKQHKEAELTGVRWSGDGRPVEFLTYALSGVIVTSVSHGDTDVQPTEQFALTYQRFEITYTPQTSTGAAGTPIAYAVDWKFNA